MTRSKLHLESCEVENNIVSEGGADSCAGPTKGPKKPWTTGPRLLKLEPGTEAHARAVEAFQPVYLKRGNNGDRCPS